ncbi:hypothetical protein B0H67DRAFT_299474 [Lasiosphaeris hirsuta]|uniref:Uncharacterized protein n=1 Tax=Lasiosphaeris hirsuta TaxID=260670 RepID=A0AA40A9D9_9PEZI|nr:hypothetical protein B0H67DRAFT_299474 [Lasiosphaeris hirsuta]
MFDQDTEYSLSAWTSHWRSRATTQRHLSGAVLPRLGLRCNSNDTGGSTSTVSDLLAHSLRRTTRLEVLAFFPARACTRRFESREGSCSADSQTRVFDTMFFSRADSRLPAQQGGGRPARLAAQPCSPSLPGPAHATASRVRGARSLPGPNSNADQEARKLGRTSKRCIRERREGEGEAAGWDREGPSKAPERQTCGPGPDPRSTGLLSLLLACRRWSRKTPCAT